MTCQILVTSRLTSRISQVSPANGPVSNNINSAAEYLQIKRDLNKLAKLCAKWRIKLDPEKAKVIIFSKSQTAIMAEPALSLYADLLSYYPHVKFLGITFGNRMTFTKRFEEILKCCNKNFTAQGYWSTRNGIQVPQPVYKSTNNVLDQYLNMGLFLP